MRRHWLIPAAGFTILVAAARLDAQWQLTGDLGVSHLQQTGIPTGSAGTAGVTFDAASAGAALRSSALVARATQDRWTGQGLVTGTVVGPSAATPWWQLDFAASTFGQSHALPTTSGELAARLRLGGAKLGGAVGAGGGVMARAASSSQTWRGLADGWITAGRERFLASAALSSAPVLGVVPRSAPTPRVRYLDLSIGWRHDVGGLSVGAATGYRDGMGEVDDGSWGAGDATFWVTSRAAIVLAAGTALTDVVRGTPRSTYVSAALRISARPHIRLVLGGGSPTGVRAQLTRGANGAQLFEIIAPGASRVELRADFTGWESVQLDHTGRDAFRLTTPVSAGLHRLAIRIDDGEWTAPPNLPHAEDGLGGRVALITVP